MNTSPRHEPAQEPNDLERLFVERANCGDLEGLVALYEVNAILCNGHGRVAVGLREIRSFLAGFLATHSRLEPSIQAPALVAGGIALTSSQLSNGQVTAEIARRQKDGTWLWVVDQFAM